MKRLLFIAAAPPLPTNNGQRLRIWSLLRALAAEGLEIHLLTFARPDEIRTSTPALAEVCQTIESVPLTLASWSSGGDYRRRLRTMFSSAPFGVERFRSPAMTRRIADRLQEGFDAVLVDSIYSAVNLPDDLRLPLILDDNNIEHMILKRYLKQERNPLRRAYTWLEWGKLRRWEQAVAARADLVMLCSETDHDLMRDMCPESMAMMVPNIIDVDVYEPAPIHENNTVLYLGSMDWFPNRDAVEFFVQQILPKLRTMAPGVRFIVVFSPEHAPPQEYRERLAQTPNVELVASGRVSREVADSAVFVVPLRIGSGTRFKILEAAAMAKAIVSTRVGAEGLDFQDGEEILLEDEPGAFAQAVARCLADAGLRARLGCGARHRVKQQYDFAAMRTRLRAALASLLNHHEPSQNPSPHKRALHSALPVWNPTQERPL